MPRLAGVPPSVVRANVDQDEWCDIARHVGAGLAEMHGASTGNCGEYEPGGDITENGNATGRALFYLGAGKGGEGRSTYLAAELDEYDDINYGIGIVFRFR